MKFKFILQIEIYIVTIFIVRKLHMKIISVVIINIEYLKNLDCSKEVVRVKLHNIKNINSNRFINSKIFLSIFIIDSN